MKDQINTACLNMAADAIADLQSRVERLEGVEGADRRLVTPDAERLVEEGDEEQRSVEDRRVTPGEAKAMFEYLKSKAAYCRSQAKQDVKNDPLNSKESYNGSAAAYEEVMRYMQNTGLHEEPKPDSERSERPA